MNTSTIDGPQNTFAALRRLARKRQDAEQCEFCSVLVGPGHRHLFEPATRKIICACDACALRFENVVGRWELIPRDIFKLADFRMSDADWECLALPIQLAFLFRSKAADRVVAMYPSPAGATESLLSLANWDNLVAANPALADLKPNVQALLIHRLTDAPEYYVAPIDVCFELVGLIRLHWRGFSGGENVWHEVEGFFTRLRERARLVSAIRMEVSHA